jgi:hypothetical protein
LPVLLSRKAETKKKIKNNIIFSSSGLLAAGKSRERGLPVLLSRKAEAKKKEN